MKIGFSFGRCVRSIVLDEVKIDDVLCIIARTYMPNEQDVQHVIDHYMHEPRYLGGLDPERCHEVGLKLWKTGRVIEPRQNGIHVMSAPQDCVWMDLYPTVVGSENASVQAAWEGYRMLIQLAEQVPEPDESYLKAGGKDSKHDAANYVPPSPEEIAAQKAALDLLIRSI